MVEEDGVHRLAEGVVAAEGEAQVRDAAARPRAGAALLDPRQRLEEVARVGVVLLDPGRHRQDVRVEDQVLGREALGRQEVVRATADLDSPGNVGRLALLVERHHDDARAVVANPPRLLEERLLALLQADRVDDPLALDRLQPGLDHAPAGAVDHHRDPRDLRLGCDHVEERAHRLDALEQVGVHVHVEGVRAAAHLLERDLHRPDPVARLDEAPESRRARHVRPLADQDEARVRADLERLEAAPVRHVPHRRDRTRREALHRAGDRRGVIGARAAAAAGNVQEPGLGELAQEAARDLGRLVVTAECVREPRVRVHADQARRHVRELRDVGPHLVRPQAAVDPDDQRLGVLDRGPERLDRLAGEHPAGAVDDRRRDPERQIGHALAGRDDRGLGVQRVEDRLEHQQIHPALGQRQHLLCVGLLDLVEGVRAVARVVDARAERQRHVERPDRAGDEPVAGDLARDPRAGDVHLVHERLERVVGLTDRRRGERVRGRDVGAGREVLRVDVGHEIRPGQVEDVGVARDVDRVIGEARATVVRRAEIGPVDQRAPGTVEHEDPLSRDRS